MATNTKTIDINNHLRSRLRYAGVTQGLIVRRAVSPSDVHGVNNTVQHVSLPANAQVVPEIKNKIPASAVQNIKSFNFSVPKLPKNIEFTRLESFLAQNLDIPEDKTSRPHTHHKHRHRRQKLRIKPAYVFGAMAAVVFLFGMGVSLQGLLTNKKVEAQVKQASTSNDTELPPQEDSPSAFSESAYSVAPNLPRLIRIPKIKVESRITRLGMQSNGKLRSPGNIFDTGWFEGSAKPNESGAMLLAGHVHGPTKPGVFYNLHKLVAGDLLEVERGDGQVFNYKVVETKTYHRDNVDMAAAMTPFLSGERGLNIITCSGDIDDSGNHYEDRLIVYAVQQ